MADLPVSPDLTPTRMHACMHGGADFGVEKAVSIQGDNAAAISAKIEQLIKHGEALPK